MYLYYLHEHSRIIFLPCGLLKQKNKNCQKELARYMLAVKIHERK